MMKTIVSSTFGLVMLAGLYAGTATANGSEESGTYAKQQGFLHDIRQAQLSHVAQHKDGGAGAPCSVDATQSFGHAGGVLNDIWRSHFTAYTGHANVQRKAARHEMASPRDFLTDVRRSQFRDSDV